MRHFVPALALPLILFCNEAAAEVRLYHLKVTLRNGKRYETISAFDPVNYCHANGGSVVYKRDYSLVFSPEMKIKILRTWVDPMPDLAGRWREILRADGMLRFKNHKALPKIEPLTVGDMMRPE